MIEIPADEHIKNSVQESLKSKGVNVSSLWEEGLMEAEDEEIIEHALENQMAVLTNDSDFETLEENRDHFGIFLLTTQYAQKQDIVSEIVKTVDQLSKEELRNSKIYIP